MPRDDNRQNKSRGSPVPLPRRPPGPVARRLTPQERADLIGHLRTGFGPVQARDEAGVSRHRLTREKKADPEYAATLKAAEAEGRQFLRDQAYGLALAGDRSSLLALVTGAQAAARADRAARTELPARGTRGKPPARHAQFNKVVEPWRQTWGAVYRWAFAQATAAVLDLVPEGDREAARERLNAIVARATQ